MLLPDFNTLTVSAEEPVTYYVKYLSGDNQWRYMNGNTWNDSVSNGDLYYMQNALKDGDSIIIDGDNPGFQLKLSVHLKNLTLLHGSQAVVTAKGYDECYILRDSVGAINGDVTNAYVYDNGRCTFNNNVKTLTIQTSASYANNTLLHANVTSNGTVEHLIAKDSIQLHYEHYNFAPGKLVIADGEVKTDAAHYSNSSSAAGNTLLYIFEILVLCLIGAFILKKTAFKK